MKKKAILLFRYIFFGLGILIIYSIGQKTGWNNIIQVIEKIRISHIVFLILFPLTWTYLHTIGWMLLIDERRTFKIKHILGSQLASTAMSEILPLGQAGGEPYRIYFVRKYYDRAKSPNIIASVILYNTIHTVATGVIILIGFIFSISNITVSTKGKYIFIALVVVGAFLLFFFIQRQKKGFMGPLFETLSKIKFLQKFAERKKTKAYEVDEKLNNFYSKHRVLFYISLLVILIAKILGVFEIYFIMGFIKHPISFEDSFMIFSATSFVQILFFFFPSQVGASEGSIVYMVKMLGNSTASGMALAMIRRARLIIWTLIGWIIAHFYGPKIHDFK